MVVRGGRGWEAGRKRMRENPIFKNWRKSGGLGKGGNFPRFSVPLRDKKYSKQRALINALHKKVLKIKNHYFWVCSEKAWMYPWMCLGCKTLTDNRSPKA